MGCAYCWGGKLMWHHYCPVEKTVLGVERGQPCNWCDAKEPSAEDNLRQALRDSMDMNGEPRKQKDEGDWMNTQHIINALAGIVMAFICWWCNNIWNAVQAQQQQITQLNVELARNYVPRIELQARFDKIDAQLEHIIQNQKESHK